VSDTSNGVKESQPLVYQLTSKSYQIAQPVTKAANGTVGTQQHRTYAVQRASLASLVTMRHSQFV